MNDPALVAPRLLAWFDEHGRVLPWRGCGDPYRIWVSEIMCQQTRVDVVIPHYHRFLARFPSITALAAADRDDVLAAWSGLGFYRRAASLHAAARQVMEEWGGELPVDPFALQRLPGIGRYTAGAILSAAFDARLPILDGNVVRVLSRFFHVRGPPDQAAVQQTLWALATAVLPERRPGDFNQALMDLGAMVCRPSSPRCGECPLRSGCAAHAAGDADALPAPGRRQEVRVERRVALVVRAPGDRVLLWQRPARGLLAGLWEAPAWELPEPGALQSFLADAKRELLPRLDADGEIDDPVLCGVTEHRFSHRHWTTTVVRLDVGATEPDRARHRWVSPGEYEEIALPTASRKVLDLALVPPANDQPRRRADSTQPFAARGPCRGRP